MSDNTQNPPQGPLQESSLENLEDRNPTSTEINLHGMKQNQNTFEVNPSSKFKAIDEEYVKKKGVSPDSARFFLPDGRRIFKHETPDSLDMAHGDVVDAMLEQIGGNAMPEVEVNQEGNFNLNIKIRDQHGNEVFEINSCLAYSKLIATYCKHQEVRQDLCNYLLQGLRIQGCDTPEALNMVDEDYLEQTGGSDEGAETPIRLGIYITINLEAKPAGEDHFQVNARDFTGNKLFFKIKSAAQLGKFMHAFCDRHGVAKATRRFMFDSIQINSQMAAKELDMEGNSWIEVFVEQSGGLNEGVGSSNQRGELLDGSSTNVGITDQIYTLPKLLNIKVADQSGNKFHFRIKKTTRFAKVMDAWATGRNINNFKADELRWLFDGTKRIFENDTPESLGMEDGDQIDVFEPQWGGRQVDNHPIISTNPQDVDTATHLNLEVIDEEDTSLFVCAKRSTPLGMILQAWCDFTKNVISEHVFMFNGKEIVMDLDAQSIGMNNKDIILVSFDIGMNPSVKSPNTPDVEDLQLKVKGAAPLDQVMDKWCEQTGLQRDQIRLYFKGTRLEEGETLAPFELKNGTGLGDFHG